MILNLTGRELKLKDGQTIKPLGIIQVVSQRDTQKIEGIPIYKNKLSKFLFEIPQKNRLVVRGEYTSFSQFINDLKSIYRPVIKNGEKLLVIVPENFAYYLMRSSLFIDDIVFVTPGVEFEDEGTVELEIV